MKMNQWTKLVLAATAGALLPMPAVYIGHTLQEDRHKKELRECAEELVEPDKCGKLWQYAASLEDENSRLNSRLQACSRK